MRLWAGLTEGLVPEERPLHRLLRRRCELLAWRLPHGDPGSYQVVVPVTAAAEKVPRVVPHRGSLRMHCAGAAARMWLCRARGPAEARQRRRCGGGERLPDSGPRPEPARR